MNEGEKTAREELQEQREKLSVRLQETKDQYPWAKEHFEQIEKEAKALSTLIRDARFKTARDAWEFIKKHNLERMGECYVLAPHPVAYPYIIRRSFFSKRGVD